MIENGTLIKLLVNYYLTNNKLLTPKNASLSPFFLLHFLSILLVLSFASPSYLGADEFRHPASVGRVTGQVHEDANHQQYPKNDPQKPPCIVAQRTRRVCRRRGIKNRLIFVSSSCNLLLWRLIISFLS